MSDFILDEILTNILVKLPFQCLVQFRCVSKSWRNLIDTSYFKSMHSARSRLIQTYPHPDSKMIAIFDAYDWNHKQLYTFDSVVRKGKGLCKANVKQLSKLEQGNYNIVGSSNGILFLVNYGPWGLFLKEDCKFVFCNPFTSSYFELPSPPDEFIDNGRLRSVFGYDHLNDDYKVLIWQYGDSYDEIGNRWYALCVYSLKQKSWRVIKPAIPFELPEDYLLVLGCTMANGSAHWLHYNYNSFIVAFDLATYEFRKISCNLSPDLDGRMTCLNGCLSLMYYLDDHHRRADIWVMEDYGDETSWKKVASIDHSLEIVALEMPVAMLQKGKKLLLKDNLNNLVIYDTERKTVSKVAVKGTTYACPQKCREFCYYDNYWVCVGSFVNPASYP